MSPEYGDRNKIGYEVFLFHLLQLYPCNVSICAVWADIVELRKKMGLLFILENNNFFSFMLTLNLFYK